MGDALALSISETRGFRLEDFALLHPGGSLGRRFLKVKDLMRTADRVPSVAREAPMPAAIHEMSRKMMGVTAVVDGDGTLFGVISDGDLRRLLEKDPAMLGRTAGECCRPSPRTIDAEEFARVSLQRMEEARITSLFIVDGAGRLTGALHMHDLLSAGIA
jgi:arabinose-5-phosphate isomerase